jgi:outer membrane biosynthesis protein TonB
LLSRFALTISPVFAPALVRAAELHPLIVTGIALDKVTTVHPTPQYPRVACPRAGIDGKVQVEVKMHNGRITDANVLSDAPMLASSAKA